MDPAEEKYLRSIARASDDVKLAHKELQEYVRKGPLRQVLWAGERVIRSTERLLNLIDQEGR